MKSSRLTTTVEKPIYDAIHDLAVKRGAAMSTVIRDLLKQALEVWQDRKYRVEVKKHSYEVVLHPDLEEGGFWIECPALPGCASQGDTVAESLEMIKEAIEGCLEVMEEDRKRVYA